MFPPAARIVPGLLSVLCAAQAGIVGGRSIGIGEAPWQLKLESGSTGCGAAWLGGRWALTAAHCVEKAPASATAVWAGITRASEAHAGNRVPIRRILIHPGWRKVDWQDIALLELDADIVSPAARPIRFAAPADVAAGWTRPGAAVWVTGWGGVDRAVRLVDSLQGVASRVHADVRVLPQIHKVLNIP